VTYRGVGAVVDALNVDAEETIEIGFSRGFDCADVRNTSIVDQDIDPPFAGQLIENFFCERLIGNVTDVGFYVRTGSGNLFRRGIRRFLVEIEYPHRRALLRETLGDGAADPACGAGDDSDFAVEPERIAAL
jgi:hypothetical protein